MTTEEKHLWYDFLKRLPMTVKRQYVVLNYILDFFIPSANIAIELDGSQHYVNDAKRSDEERDKNLALMGITTIRYTNTQVNQNFNWVVSDILKHLNIGYGELKPRN